MRSPLLTYFVLPLCSSLSLLPSFPSFPLSLLFALMRLFLLSRCRKFLLFLLVTLRSSFGFLVQLRLSYAICVQFILFGISLLKASLYFIDPLRRILRATSILRSLVPLSSPNLSASFFLALPTMRSTLLVLIINFFSAITPTLASIVVGGYGRTAVPVTQGIPESSQRSTYPSFKLYA